MTADEIEKLCRCALQKTLGLSGQGLSDGAWTEKLLGHLTCFGSKGGFYPCARGQSVNGAKHGEWLYDLCWLDYGTGQNPEARDGGENSLKQMLLAVECEWHTGWTNLMDDFEKLMCASVPLRFFVCQTWGKVTPDEIFTGLHTAVSNCRNARDGDRYLLAVYTKKPHVQFAVRSFEKGGPLSNADCLRPG